MASRGATATGMSGKDYDQLIDGNTTNYDGENGYAYTNWKAKPSYFLVTLDKTYAISKLRMLLWDKDSRFYRYKIEVSPDGINNWKLVANKTAPTDEARGWQEITLNQPMAVKVIKVTGTYNSANANFHVVELEAYVSSNTTTYEYDAEDELLSVTDPLGNISKNFYDSGGNLVLNIDPKGNITTYEYDANDRLTRTVDSLGNAMSYTYDEDGNRIQTVDQLGYSTRSTFDALNRLRQTINAINHKTEFKYDANGNLVKTLSYRLKVDGSADLTAITQKVYDVLNRLTATIDPLGYQTSQEYDALGRITKTWSKNANFYNSIHDPASIWKPTQKTYTLNDLLNTETDPLGILTKYTYDKNDNLTATTLDPTGLNQITSYAYDELDRLTAVTDPRGTLFFDDFSDNNYNGWTPLIGIWQVENDNLSSDTNGTSTNYISTLLPAGQISLQFRVKFLNGYNADNASRVFFDQDDLNHINFAMYTKDSTYNPSGFYIGQNENGNWSYYETKFKDSSKQERSIEYNTNYDVTILLKNNLAEVYLDGIYQGAYTRPAPPPYSTLRLGATSAKIYFDNIKVTSLDYTTTYTYDARGNKISMTDPLGTTRYEYDDNNRLIAAVDPLGNRLSYTYDPEGNLLSTSDGTKTTQYTYDANNRLTSESEILLADDFSLAAYYSFNEGVGTTARNQLGSNNATIYGATWAQGKSGQALSFDGIDDYVTTALNLSSQEMTGEAWVFVPAAPSEKKGILTASAYSFHMWINPDGSFNFGAWTTTTNEEYAGLKTYPFNTWHHVVVVNKGGAYTKLYVDGVLDRELSLSGNLQAITAFDIGRHPGWNGSYLNGLIDEVRIYSRALSAEEIKAHYQGQIPPQSWTPTQGTWTLENGELKGVGAGGNIDGWIYAGDASWTDYALEGKAIFETGNAEFVFRSTGHWQNEYRLEVWSQTSSYNPNRISLSRFKNGAGVVIVDIASPTPITNPAQVKIELKANNIKVYLNNTLVLNYTDSDPLLTGRIGLGVIWDWKARFDEIKVYKQTSYEYDAKGRRTGITYPDGKVTQFEYDADDHLIKTTESDTRGLTAHYSFNEGSGTTAKDSSGSNNATIYGATWITGKYGSGITTSGNAYVSISPVDIGTEWTIVAWFLAPIPQPVANYATLTRGTNDHQILAYEGRDLGTFDNAGGTAFHDSGFDLTTLSNGWHHLVAVGTTSGTTQYYIDGVYKASSNFRSTADIVAIGNYQGGGQPFGTFDEVKIYNRALSESEVKFLYQPRTVTYQYDSHDNLTQISTNVGADVSVRLIQYTYNARDELTTINTINPITQQTTQLVTYEYDPNGNITSKTLRTPNSQLRTIYIYDITDRLTELKTTDAQGNVIQHLKYEYNAADNITAINTINPITQQTTQLTNYSYDPANQLISLVLSGVEGDGTYTYTYDPNGNRTAKKDAQTGQTLETYSYNSANQITGHWQLATGSSNYTYDASGNTLSNGQFTFTYDAKNRLIKVEPRTPNSELRTIEYTYDAQGRRTSKTTYNPTFSDDFNDGNSNGWTPTHGTWTVENGELKGVGAGGNIDGWIYTGSDNWADYTLEGKAIFETGNAEFVFRSTGHWQNEYRLTFWSQNSSYAPNRIGLSRFKNGAGVVIVDIASPVPITNPTQVKIELRGSNIKVYLNNTLVLDYSDPDPLLKGKVGLGVIWDWQGKFDEVKVTEIKTTNYLYNEISELLLYEYDEEGRVIRSYITDTDEYGELISVQMPDASGQLKTYYYLYDGIGQIIGLVDETGKIVVKYSYDSWGVPKEYLENKTTGLWEEVSVGTFGNLYLYKGYYYDTETGLYYLNARYYDPTLGRFLTPDPDGGEQKDKLSLNPYIYVKNNPINEDDPDGHNWWARAKKWAERKYRQVKKEVKKTVKKIEKKIEKTVKKLTSKVSKAIKSVSKAIKSASKAVKKVVKSVAKQVTKAGKTLAKAYSSSPGGKALSSAGRTISQGAKTISQSPTAKKVADLIIPNVGKGYEKEVSKPGPGIPGISSSKIWVKSEMKAELKTSSPFTYTPDKKGGKLSFSASSLGFSSSYTYQKGSPISSNLSYSANIGSWGGTVGFGGEGPGKSSISITTGRTEEAKLGAFSMSAYTGAGHKIEWDNRAPSAYYTAWNVVIGTVAAAFYFGPEILPLLGEFGRRAPVPGH